MGKVFASGPAWNVLRRFFRYFVPMQGVDEKNSFYCRV